MSEILIHKGSTKDVYKLNENYLFKFSDRYSVFDWGEMPDHLKGKGCALAAFTKSVYKVLEKEGVSHHLLPVPCAQNEIVVRPFEVVRDGSSLRDRENVFIPLEIIFRLGFAKGSSLKKRMKSPEDWIKAGYDREYQELEMFSSPAIEFTTKLERFDRPLTHEEARELSGLNQHEWEILLTRTTKIAQTLKNIFAEQEIILWDGKVEMAAGELKGAGREIILVDSIGPDELRLTKNGIQLSKEIIRQYYRSSEWYSRLDEVKEKFGEKFKDYISLPPALSKEFKSAVEEMYSLLPELINKPSEVNLKMQRLLPKLRALL